MKRIVRRDELLTQGRRQRRCISVIALTMADRNVGALVLRLDARAPDGLRAGCDGAVTGSVGIAGMPI
jgi:hypothetical protein